MARNEEHGRARSWALPMGIVAIATLCGAAYFMVRAAERLAAAQEEARRAEETARGLQDQSVALEFAEEDRRQTEAELRQALEVKASGLERKLDETRVALTGAEAAGDAARAAALRAEMEQVFAELEEVERIAGELERAREPEGMEWRDGEDHFHQMEVRQREMELERFALETEIMRLELDTRIAATAESPTAAAVAAIRQLGTVSENQYELAEQLTKALAETTDPALRRVIRMHLAELHRELDRPEDARKTLRAIIVGKGGE